MGKITTTQTNFTAGEISPRLQARQDVDRYANAARALLNVHPVIHGGAKRRAGSRYYKPAKFSNKMARLIPFVYSRDESYIMEVGDGYIRVHGAGGVDLGVELVSPYNEAAAQVVDYTQGENLAFFAHESAAIQRLRLLDGTFSLAAAPISPEPFAENGIHPATTLSLSSAAVGSGRTATAGASTFLKSDVGRAILAGAGVATITGYTSATQVTCTISAAFAGTSIASGDWQIDSSPQAFLRPTVKEPAGSVVTLRTGLTRAATLTLSDKTGAITINASASVFTGGDTGKWLFSDSGMVQLTYVSGTQCSGTVAEDFISTSYETGTYGISDEAWRAADVGSFVRVNEGLVRITAVGTSSEATGVILSAMSSTVAAPPLAWSIESSAWGGVNGYPRTVTMHDQRLVAAGSENKPQTVWGSRVGDFFDFTLGTNDDDAFAFTIAGDQVNRIAYVSSMRNILVNTFGGEFSIQGGIEKPITPTNVRIRPESSHGCKEVRPVTVGKESVFVQRSGRKVRAMGYRYDVDGYASPDLAVLAEHITATGVQGMTYQQEPDLLLWAWLGDGSMVSCTFDRDQQVIGWARHQTEGVVESMATIQNGDIEETWLLVRRTVDGATVRYLEIFDEDWQAVEGGDPWGYTVDCGKEFDSATAVSSVSVPHLIGCEVDILADGVVQPRQTVPSSGTLILARAASRVLVGLPFTSTIGFLSPAIGVPSGSGKAASKRPVALSLEFLKSIGGEVVSADGMTEKLISRQFGADVLDNPLQTFTGELSVSLAGWTKGRIVIDVNQAQPLPLHLLSATFVLEAND